MIDDLKKLAIGLLCCSIVTGAVVYVACYCATRQALVDHECATDMECVDKCLRYDPDDGTCFDVLTPPRSGKVKA